MLHTFSSAFTNLHGQDHFESLQHVAVLQGAVSIGYVLAAVAVISIKPSSKRCLLFQSLLATAGNMLPLLFPSYTGLLISRLLLGLGGPLPIAIRFLTNCVSPHSKHTYWLWILAGSVAGLLCSFPVAQAGFLYSYNHYSMCFGLCAVGWSLLSLCVYTFFRVPGEEETLDISPFLRSTWSPSLVGWTVFTCRMASEILLTVLPIIFRRTLSYSYWKIALSMASCQFLNLYILLLLSTVTSLFPTLTIAIIVLGIGSLLACWCSPIAHIIISCSILLINSSTPLCDLGAFSYFSILYPKSEGKWQIPSLLGALTGDLLVWLYLSHPETLFPSVYLPILLLCLAIGGLVTLRSSTHSS